MSRSGHSSTRLEKAANDIADAIVAYVERQDGPVTLAELDRNVPGFAAHEPSAYTFYQGADEQVVLWDGMTKEGVDALAIVLNERRVAIQYVSPKPYLLDGRFVAEPNWQPAMLLPAKAANLKASRWLIRASPRYQSYSIQEAAAQGRTGYRLLTPAPLRYTADQFSLGA